MSARRVVAALLAMMLGSVLISVVSGTPPAAAEGAPSDTAVTKSGTDEFANLQVTVSQTQNLINQTVRVSWTGAAKRPGSPLLTDFLQIMQCWGDNPAGPDRTQCEFGATKPFGGDSAGRTIPVPGSDDADPAETLAQLPNGQTSFVPFWPAGRGQMPTVAAPLPTNEFFDSQITNEMPQVFNGADGSGYVNFEIQTVRQNAGLGCGDPVQVNGTISGRSCWLVVVPRGTTEVNGSDVSNKGLLSSALSPTNFSKGIAIPLGFRPQGQPCPLGAPERRLSGHELPVDAVSSWQPALCLNGGASYSFTQLNDDAVRGQLLTATDPGLAMMSNPVPPDQLPPDRPLVYAPVALSGLTFAFNIVKNPSPPLPPTDARNAGIGQPFTEMTLTPRLVAKLLTQSYRGAVVQLPAGQLPDPKAPPPLPSTNSWGLTNDPEFLKLNSEYSDLLRANLSVDVLVQLGTSDLIGMLWDWVLADTDARAFLNGTKDPWGMVVNEANKNLLPPLDAYPRNDQGCQTVSVNDFQFNTGKKVAPFCTGDAHQFADDMHQAGRAASRGDPLARDGQNGTVGADGSVSYPKAPREGTTAALIAVVDAATAVRYGLPTAKLRNAAGQDVAPDTAGLLAGEAAMKPSGVPGVLQPDPATKDPLAYPLTTLSYAATSTPALTPDEGRDYATFLRYAVGVGQQSGQQPGQLPLGYVPLPDRLRQQALATATIIATQAGKSTRAPAPPFAASNPGVTTPNLSGPAAPNTSPSGGTSPNLAPASASGSPGAASSPTSVSGTTPGPTTVATTRRTPALPAPAVGALILTILICGALAATSAPVLQSPVIHRLTAAVRRHARGGVRPTER
ncbi:MAG: hypothetical protein M3Y73_12240 [Actinomycetota bacterium]|nr:hypothetical protein [Actinomycetota bacterium]